MTAAQLDAALQVALALSANAGIPVADGQHALAFQRLEQSLTSRADSIPSSAAIYAAIRRIEDRDKGDPGTPATVEGQTVTYQVSTSGTTVPTGDWLAAVPAVAPGQYLWTKTDVTFNTGDTITWYSVSRMGIDGTGAVSTVCGVDPDSGGNVPLTGADIPQSSDDPTSVSTAISGKQAKITASGLLKGNGSGGVSAAVAGTDYQSPVKSATVTLSASAWSNNAQTVSVSNVTTGSLVTVAPVPTAQNRTAYLESGVYCSAQGAGTLTFVCEDVPSVNLDVNIQIINK